MQNDGYFLCIMLIGLTQQCRAGACSRRDFRCQAKIPSPAGRQAQCSCLTASVFCTCGAKYRRDQGPALRLLIQVDKHIIKYVPKGHLFSSLITFRSSLRACCKLTCNTPSTIIIPQPEKQVNIFLAKSGGFCVLYQNYGTHL